MEETVKERCQFWLPKKKRFCAIPPLNASSFCGNHTQRPNALWIQCPIDPSHSVLEENLEGHVKRCPLLKQAQSLSLQPYYQKGINCGRDELEEKEEEAVVSSEKKRSAVYDMTISEFTGLMSKIRSVHRTICKYIRDSYRIPDACDIWINREVDRRLPYQEKHVLQQASILGNLEDAEVFKIPTKRAPKESFNSPLLCQNQNEVPAVVEFGAGRGYLTQMLADCYGIKKVFLVERKSYKLKADRSLRKKESLMLERLRIDIEDLNLNAVNSLTGIPYLAIGKHLCGPATDLTLRCCIPEHHVQDNSILQAARTQLKGLAIATCCHHLCQWKHYINKKYLRDLGFDKEEFHAVTWFTSWAVDADHSSDLANMNGCESQLQSRDEEELAGEAIGVEEIQKQMKAAERAALGFMCKDIIDVGRLMWVKEQGLEAELVKYVPSSISPENRLLVASQSKEF